MEPPSAKALNAIPGHCTTKTSMDDLTFSIQVSPALGRGELILAIVPFHIQLVELNLQSSIVESYSFSDRAK